MYLKGEVYDFEININSIIGFLKVWTIKYSKEGKKRYEFTKKNLKKYIQ